MVSKRILLIVLSLLIGSISIFAQNGSLIHSHNDYSQAKPFYGAFKAGANSIEADVWCVDGELFVSHDKEDIRKENTLRKMYLMPIKKALQRKKAHAAPLQLMVDVKNGKAALDKLVEIIEQEGYRPCFDTSLNPSAIRLTITCWEDLSDIWDTYPGYVCFDARPGAQLSEAQWKRVSTVSQGMYKFSKWKGVGEMPEADKAKIRKAAEEAHSKGLPFRIWGFPDSPEAWQLCVSLGIDFINTDHPEQVAKWLSARSGGKGGTIVLNSEADLSGLTISCSAGNYYENKYSARKDVKVFACNSEPDALQAVRQGFADVFVTDEVLMSQETVDRMGLKLAMLGDDVFDVAFATQKGDAATLDALNGFLEASKADGSLDALINHWLKGTPMPPEPESGAAGNPSPLRCICCLSMAPVCFLGEGGTWQGLEPDIIHRFAKSCGRPYEIQFQNLGAGITALAAGQADILFSCLFATDERRKTVDFSIPYYKCHPGYYVLDKGKKPSLSFSDKLKMNLVTESRWKLITDGLWETIKITLLSILLGTLLGAGVCAMKRSRRKWVRSTVAVYGSLIQGIPTLVLLLIMFYVILAGTGLSASTVAIITFAMCFAWSSGGIFDTSISSVPKGQTEAGLGLGFTQFRTFTGIVFPQALKKGLPLYAGECVSLLKNTSIVGYIAIQDLTRASDLIRSRTFDALIPLLLITIIYFVLAWIIRLLLNFLVKK